MSGPKLRVKTLVIEILDHLITFQRLGGKGADTLPCRGYRTHPQLFWHTLQTSFVGRLRSRLHHKSHGRDEERVLLRCVTYSSRLISIMGRDTLLSVGTQLRWFYERCRGSSVQFFGTVLIMNSFDEFVKYWRNVLHPHSVPHLK